MFNLNKRTKMKSKPIPTRKLKNRSHVGSHHRAQLSYTTQNSFDYFPFRQSP